MSFATMIQTADWKAEKHVPVIETPETFKAGESTLVTVSVGKEIEHPNTTEHHIRWIQLFFKPEDEKFSIHLGTAEFCAHAESIKGANAGSALVEPSAIFAIKLQTKGKLVALAYCNIHGLWESEMDIDVQ